MPRPTRPAQPAVPRVTLDLTQLKAAREAQRRVVRHMEKSGFSPAMIQPARQLLEYLTVTSRNEWEARR
jgi:hypothetical protein